MLADARPSRATSVASAHANLGSDEAHGQSLSEGGKQQEEYGESKTDRLDFPEKVTAFRQGWQFTDAIGNRAQGGAKQIQRIRDADNETKHWGLLPTGGKLLADRSLSRLLRSDCPRTLDELEALKRR